MRIVGIETVRNPQWANFLWLRLETDDGVSGLGETFRHATPIARYVHDVIAPFLLGQEAGAVNRIAHDLRSHGGLRFLGYPTRSVEIRANSAVDIALWDLKGKVAGLPLSELIGGPMRDRIAIYNTCAGAGYNWHAGPSRARMAGQGTDDLDLQRSDPGRLAASLLADGIKAMKIWPFDAAAEATGGRHISAEALKEGLAVLAAIRAEVGDAMEILLEYHSLWQPPAARRILTEADAYKPFWHEDPVAMENLRALSELRAASSTPIAGSESHGTAVWLRDALAAGAVDHIHTDIAWTGGISEALKVAAMAGAHDLSYSPHDCTGPVTWVANLHLALALPNALWLESVRAYWQDLYPRLVTELPRIDAGMAHPMTGPGLGTELSDALLSHPQTIVERSTL